MPISLYSFVNPIKIQCEFGKENFPLKEEYERRREKHSDIGESNAAE